MKMRTLTTMPITGPLLTVALVTCALSAPLQAGPTYMDLDKLPVDRTVLPLKEPALPVIKTRFVEDLKEQPPLFKATAPKGAPNVVIIMLDDIGYGGMGTFGGVVDTPAIDRLAEGGIRYTQFHSTAQCASTRIALNTGRNHHSANTGIVGEMSTSVPGYTGRLPSDIAALPKILKYNGYNTAAFGKWHMTEAYNVTPTGPFDNWPNYMGYEYFYGFMGGETHQWYPSIYENQNPVEPPDVEGYHFMNDMTDKAISWMKTQQALSPEKPFYMYFTPGAVHAPHHVPESYIEKYRGKFDEGWDVIRERIFENQKRLGVVPKDTKLPPKAPVVPDWKDLTDQEKKIFAHQAAVFAAFLDMADSEAQRLLDEIEELGIMDNTLIFYIAGDNGTSPEGQRNGTFNEYTTLNGASEELDFLAKHIDEWGSDKTYPHMATGWAVAFDSPFSYFKQVASNYGGTRQGTVVHWPAGIKAKGEIRHQWHHIIDVVPTILEATDLPQPTVVEGIPQRPIEGVSMAYTFDDAEASDRHLVQYFEMFGNRGIYSNGWFAGTVHFYPGITALGPISKFADDPWELYHVAEDFSMAEDLSKKYPEKLKELEEMFYAEAEKYHVLPIDDRLSRFNATIAGRPTVLGDRKSQVLYEGMGYLSENAFVNIKNASWDIVADIESQGAKTSGVLVQQGGTFGGWSFYVLAGKPVFTYNWFGMEQYKIVGDSILPEGKSSVKMDFAYKGGKKLGKGGTVTLSINGKKVGSGKVEKTEPTIFSADETSNVGIDRESMVVPDDYTHESSRFNGKIEKVTINLK